MTIKEVKTQNEVRQFLDLPKKIYKNDPHWIQPLDKDIEAVFDPKKNPLFQQKGECKRWLLLSPQKEVIGRVATFINPKYKEAQPTGGIGFFEVIKDQKAANYLLDHCQNWLKERGMEAMDGPINFGERDRWWGMLTRGADDPLYCMNYNPSYYVDFFEAYGFQVYFRQLCFGMDIHLDLDKKFFENHEKIAANPNIQARPIRKKELDKYALDFAKIYNEAWAQHNSGKTLSDRGALKIFHSMKPVLDENISWIVYEKEDPVACWINLPDLNYYFKEMKGKFGLFQKLKFLYLKATRPCPRMTGLVFGVVPRWQKTGLDSYMIIEASKTFIPKTNYKKYEMQWIGDFNPKMINIARSLGADVTRELATYRFLFDRNKKFERHPVV